jgi:curved DNA-binding protein CbpA
MDLYEILQVDRRADLEVIRAAYRVLARRHHPDLGGDSARMAAVNEAWATLSDPVARARYDAVFRRQAQAARAAEQQRADAVGVMTTAQAYQPPPPAPSPTAPGAAGVLDFGRYAGWSLADLGRHDPDYLLWLERTPIGRPLRSEIQRIMEMRRGAAVASAAPAPRTRAGTGRWSRQA